MSTVLAFIDRIFMTASRPMPAIATSRNATTLMILARMEMVASIDESLCAGAVARPEFYESTKGSSTDIQHLEHLSRCKHDSVQLRKPETNEHGAKNALRSAHEPKRVGEKLRAAEISGLQSKQHVAFSSTDRAQHGNARRDLCSHEKSGNLQPVDHRAGCLPAGDDQTLHAGQH